MLCVQKCHCSGEEAVHQLSWVGIQGSIAVARRQWNEDAVAEVGRVLADVRGFAAAVGLVDFFQ